MNLKIGTFFGIPLFFNLLTILFGLYIYSFAELEGVAIWTTGLFMVVFHEYGHCIAARKCGMFVQSVTILPIGGVARMQFSNNPKTEIIVALAGPAVNLVFALISLPFFIAALYYQEIYTFIASFTLLVLNLIILIFNLIPIFPMDGGRVFRALLSMKLGHERGTWWAVRVGQTIAAALIIVCLILAQEQGARWYVTAAIFAYVMYMGQMEIVNSRLLSNIARIKIKVAHVLHKPELISAPLSETILALEGIKDEVIKKQLRVTELIQTLKDVQEVDRPFDNCENCGRV